MKVFDACFESCADLQTLFQPLSPNLSALQLSDGPLEGHLRIIHCGFFRLNQLKINQALFLSGTRRPKPCTISIPLSDPPTTDPIRAQGVCMPWAGMMGYNDRLNDFDLRLPAGTTLATLTISRDHLLERHSQHGAGRLSLDRWRDTNQLELREPLRSELRARLKQLIEQDDQAADPRPLDELIGCLLRAFEDVEAQSMTFGQREARHEAAIDLLHWFSRHSDQNLTMEELSAVLYQSRTSLFKGCQEHFGRTPQNLQRSIRLDLVRQLLLDPNRCDGVHLQGVGTIAAHLGFTSRSHFARRYRKQYGELPQETLRRSKAAGRSDPLP